MAKKLCWIHAPAAAVHQLLIPEVVNSHVVVTNARQVHGPVVAEHVIALVFALAKKIPQAVRLQQRRVRGQELIWNDRPKPCELAGATLGLIGLVASDAKLREEPPLWGYGLSVCASTQRRKSRPGSMKSSVRTGSTRCWRSLIT